MCVCVCVYLSGNDSLLVFVGKVFNVYVGRCRLVVINVLPFVCSVCEWVVLFVVKLLDNCFVYTEKSMV